MTPGLEDLNGEIPMWLKVVYRLGVPAGIALFLVWFVTLGFAADIRTVKEALTKHSAEQRFYLRAICINTAQTDAQRALCIQSDLER